MDAGADRIGEHTALCAGVQGSPASAGGVFATHTFNDSFAVVETGYGGIEVLREILGQATPG